MTVKGHCPHLLPTVDSYRKLRPWSLLAKLFVISALHKQADVCHEAADGSAWQILLQESVAEVVER
jgi:hypothetical protein